MYTRVLKEIRHQIGFENFLLPPAAIQAVEHAGKGPLVAVNIHQRRCDAIVIDQNGVTNLLLYNLTWDDIIMNVASLIYVYDNIKRNPSDANIAFERIMKWLWECAAKPILTHLGFVAPPKNGAPWPRLWWISGGVFSMFPIHAAGDYEAFRRGCKDSTVLDRVISSYSPTIKSLVYARERKQSLEKTKGNRDGSSSRAVIFCSINRVESSMTSARFD